MLSDAMIPRTNLLDPGECSHDPDEDGPDEVSRPKKRFTKNRMVIVHNSLRRRTMKVVKNSEFKSLLVYVKKY